ncbi:putative Ig domain-containing protein [Antarcticirhabdus aurantiaca]|uniref:putative Ig domain-containing protein n=1 Tax=Antarcticirhabdus aurantiaca TaxID=2606717 RepID=UPI00131CC043|nr:putative Ig domain-containing protein [Antarcticirhabdus aurantiaca]
MALSPARLLANRRSLAAAIGAGIISPGALSISGSPSAAVLGSAYSFVPTIRGGTAPYSVAVTGLAQGLSANSATGAITGTPTGSPSTLSLTFTVTDAKGATATMTRSLVIAAAVAPLAISGAPASATVGGAYSFTPSVTGGQGARSFSLSGSLPAGLSFSSSTGAITGTPTTAGTTSGLAITVTDDSGSATLPGLAITVAAAAQTLQALTLSVTSATVGSPFTAEIIGKTAGSTVDLTGPGAAGLSRSGTTVSGTPTTAGAVNLVETLAGATNSPRTSSGVLTVAAAVNDLLAPLAVHIDADIDTIGERDDISAQALWMATQEHFNIVGLTASAPDSTTAEYLNCITAYEKDYPSLIAATPYPDRFKTPAQFRAMVVQGSKVDAPAAGYWTSGNSGYAAAHAAAQLLIANAQTYGDPNSTNPRKKLWVAIQGGYTTLAQAAYEAVELGALPDFFKRIRIIGQPNYNSFYTKNAYNYLMARIWPAAGTPGIFGDAWHIGGYFQWHAFNRDNGGSDTVAWNDMTTRGAMGQHLADTLTRPMGGFSTPHFRAGDGGAWLWLLSAKVSDNFDPTNAQNWCGRYYTYVGVDPFPSQTFGYGNTVQTEVQNPEQPTWSPTWWGPSTAIDTQEKGEQYVNLAKWYELVVPVIARYNEPTASIPDIDLAGTRPTVFALEAPASATVGSPANFPLTVFGPAPSVNVTVTFSDGGTTVVPAGTTGTINVPRTPTSTAVLSLAITAVSAGRFVAGEVKSINPAPPANAAYSDYLVADWRMVGSGADQTVIDSSTHGINGYLGTTTGAETADALWTSTGLQIAGGDRVTIPYNPLMETGSEIFFIGAFMVTSGNTAIRTIASRDQGVTGKRSWIFRKATSGRLDLSLIGGGTVSMDAGSELDLATWYIAGFMVKNGTATLIMDGKSDKTLTITGGVIPASTADLLFGLRLNSSSAAADPTNEELGVFRMYSKAPSTEERAAVISEIKTIMAGRGVTI